MNIEDYHNCHRGQRCWVIGNGPSLNRMELGFLEHEITFGTNCIFLGFEKFGFEPLYYTLEDPYVAEDNRDQINALEGFVKFIPQDLSYCLKSGPETCWINFVRNYKPFPKFSFDCSKEIFWGSTVTYLALQLAYYMGCDPVYLIGVDFDYKIPDYIENDTVVSREDDCNHFDPYYFGKGKRWHHPHLEKVEQAYLHARNYFEKSGRSIVNVGVGGKLKVFKRADYKALV